MLFRKMKEKIDYRILKNFVVGKYSLKEYLLISRWFDDKTNEPELKTVIQQHWDEFLQEGSGSEKDLSLVLVKLKQKIATEKPAVSFRIKIQKIYTRAAAILLLPLIVYSVYSTFFNTQSSDLHADVEIVSPQGARTHFQLPDGTEGWLNSGSSLKYDHGFLEKRRVELIGEAWFDVVHNKKIPFLVHTKSLDVLDLGTKFNVAAYQDENITEVVLQEGKVKIDGYKGTFNVDLDPNEKFIFNKQSQSGTIQPVDADQVTAWKDGLLVFRNEPLSEVFRRVGRWYNVDIVIADADLATYKYRATFQEEQVDEVIRLISLTLPIEYSFENRVMDGNGLFKKRTITIRRKV